MLSSPPRSVPVAVIITEVLAHEEVCETTNRWDDVPIFGVFVLAHWGGEEEGVEVTNVGTSGVVHRHNWHHVTSNPRHLGSNGKVVDPMLTHLGHAGTSLEVSTLGLSSSERHGSSDSSWLLVDDKPVTNGLSEFCISAHISDVSEGDTDVPPFFLKVLFDPETLVDRFC